MTKDQAKLFDECTKHIDFSSELIMGVAYLYRLREYRMKVGKKHNYVLSTGEERHNKVVQATYEHLCNRIWNIKDDAEY